MSEKILAVERILLRNPYGISTQEIIGRLDNEYGIKAERKSIYSDIAILTRFMPIDVYRGDNNRNLYFIRTRSETS